MKLLKKCFLGLCAMLAGLVLLVAVLQTFYHFTPAALSPEAQALNTRAAKVTWTTENGYRLNGLLAPRDVDPVQYGRCLADATIAHNARIQKDAKTIPSIDDKVAYDAYWKASSQRSEALLVGCLKGGTRLQLPPLLTQPSPIRPSMTDEQWRDIQSAALDPMLLARAEAVWAGDARRLGGRVESPLPQYDVLMRIERWRIARALALWNKGDLADAISAWRRSVNEWTQSADDSLIDAMLSTNAISQTLVAVQRAASRAERIDEATAASMISMLTPIESMPEAVTNSLLAEWRAMSTLIVEMQAKDAAAESAFDGSIWSDLVPLDVNDTLNRLAQSQQFAAESVNATARGQNPKTRWYEGMTPDCEWLGDDDFLCLPFLRNPTGRMLAGIAAPMYADYGTRVADLRNFAAVTRLTIEARRRGLTGDALAQFVANAPADMRDVFSGKAFSYSAATKRLNIELRAKSTVLGDKGFYEVSL
jgi:hypothetical protein